MDATRNRWTLIAVCAGTFMLLVDVTIVQVALPTIQRHLGASFTDLQWVIDAYALSLAALILTWGSISDRFGRKRVFIAGLTVFTASSLLCGLAQSINMLIWSRALQGVGGAAMFATGLALIAQDFQGPARGKAIAAWGATVGGAVAIGPLVGGLLTSGVGWRWIFIVNVPIGVVAIWLSSTKMRNQKDPGATRLDVFGLVSFSAAMFLLELGLIQGNSLGWSSGTIVAMFCGSAVAFVAFVFVELHQTRPMFDLSLFRKPGFSGVSLATFAVGGGMFALMPYLTLVPAERPRLLPARRRPAPLADDGPHLPRAVRLPLPHPQTPARPRARWRRRDHRRRHLRVARGGTEFELDRAHPGNGARRHRHRHCQSRHRARRARRRAAGTQRHGVGYQ